MANIIDFLSLLGIFALLTICGVSGEVAATLLMATSLIVYVFVKMLRELIDEVKKLGK